MATRDPTGLRKTPTGFICSVCKKWHPGLPLDWAFDAPAYWDQIPEAERVRRGHINADFCDIDGEDFFVRGLIEIPIIGAEEAFGWGVWVSLGRPNFSRMVSLWNDPQIIEEPRYFGWLSNKIPVYPDTLNLKTEVCSKGVNTRPYIELQPADHPLWVEQHEGITPARVEEIAGLMSHSAH